MGEKSTSPLHPPHLCFQSSVPLAAPSFGTLSHRTTPKVISHPAMQPNTCNHVRTDSLQPNIRPARARGRRSSVPRGGRGVPAGPALPRGTQEPPAAAGAGLLPERSDREEAGPGINGLLIYSSYIIFFPSRAYKSHAPCKNRI